MKLKASGLHSCVGVKPAALCQPVRKLRHANSCVWVCVRHLPCARRYSVYICAQAQSVSAGVCLTRGQPGPLPAARHEPSSLSVWHLLAMSENRTRRGRPWWMAATRCVYLFVFVCATCIRTNLSHMYSFTLWIYECLSRHLLVHACITAMSKLHPKEWTGSFKKGMKKKGEGCPRRFNCCLIDKWA